MTYLGFCSKFFSMSAENYLLVTNSSFDILEFMSEHRRWLWMTRYCGSEKWKNRLECRKTLKILVSRFKATEKDGIDLKLIWPISDAVFGLEDYSMVSFWKNHYFSYFFFAKTEQYRPWLSFCFRFDIFYCMRGILVIRF